MKRKLFDVSATFFELSSCSNFYTNITFQSLISDALYILYPGEYVLGSILFLVTLFVLKNDIEYIQRQQRASEEQVGSRTVQGSIVQ